MFDWFTTLYSKNGTYARNPLNIKGFLRISYVLNKGGDDFCPLLYYG